MKAKTHTGRCKALLPTLLLIGLGIGPPADADPSPNVLFICVDDLRPQLGCYGESQMVTPRIDQLAGEGFLFRKAYVQQAVCSPSRICLMSGLRPDTTQIYDLQTHLRDKVPWVTTMSQHLMNHGWFASGIGKIYHGSLNDDASWSEPHTKGPGPYSYVLQENIDIKNTHGQGPPWENADVADNAYRDGAVADAAVAKLAQLKNQQPFFYGVGFVRPHLPFCAPKTYWDDYDETDLELPTRRTQADNAPSYAYTNWGELRGYYGMPASGDVTAEQEKSLIHGYYACVSYIDACVGEVLDALAAEGLADNTIVVLWGDHGWHLGNHGQWTKHTNFERATHIPLLMKVPWLSGGVVSDALVETVDVYPTVVELCGETPPAWLEGESFKALLENPSLPGDPNAISQYPRGDRMGYSLRTARYRYTEWRRKNTDVIDAQELYDHDVDPSEDTNVAGEPANAALVASLSAELGSRLDEFKPANHGPSVNLVKNGTFDDGLTDWTPTSNGATATFNVVTGASALGEGPALHVAITDGTADRYRLAIEQIVPAHAGKFYTLRFRARAAGPRDMRVVWRNKNNGSDYYHNQNYDLDVDPVFFEVNAMPALTLSGADPDGEIRLQFGGDNADVWIDSIELLAQSSLVRMLHDAGKSGLEMEPLVDSDGDSLSHLAEYASNMNFSLADWHRLEPGTGTSGVPAGQLTAPDASGRLKFEFLRRRDASDLAYAVEFSDGMGGGAPWVEASGTETVVPVDEWWERVSVEDEAMPPGAPSRFGRVRFEYRP